MTCLRETLRMKRLVPFVVSAALAALTAAGGNAAAVTFKWANDGDAVSMDPYMVNETFSLGFMANVYDALVVRDAGLKIVPSLATAWKPVDPNTWEFKLRHGVKFHDGTPFT